MAQATLAALPAVGDPPLFEPLRLFIAHLVVEDGGFKCDQMQRIQDFHRKKKNTPRTMYIRFTKFVI